MPPVGSRGKIEKPKDAKGTLRRILQYMTVYRYVVLALLLCTFASNIGNLLGPGLPAGTFSIAPGCVLERTVDVHITRLRKKLGAFGKHIANRSGYGYCLEC